MPVSEMSSGGTDKRFPRRVFGHGAEPDPRFTLANERTFLAWIRTSLALVAGGVALEALGLALHPGLRLTASLVLLGFGLVTPIMAWWHWARAETAMRLEMALPAPPLGLPLAVGLLVVGILVSLGILLGPDS